MEKKNTMSGDIMREGVITTLKFYLLFSPFTVIGCDKDLWWGGLREGGKEGGKREEGTLEHIYIDHTCAVITNSYTHNVRDGADHSVSTMTFNIWDSFRENCPTVKML